MQGASCAGLQAAWWVFGGVYGHGLHVQAALVRRDVAVSMDVCSRRRVRGGGCGRALGVGGTVGWRGLYVIHSPGLG